MLRGILRLWLGLLRVAWGLLRIALRLLRIAWGLLRVAWGLLRVALGLLGISRFLPRHKPERCTGRSCAVWWRRWIIAHSLFHDDLKTRESLTEMMTGNELVTFIYLCSLACRFVAIIISGAFESVITNDCVIGAI